MSSGQSARDARVGTGGPSVAKILVADDNSNIQKMVGLALKDQGIDVVAVGNGEAAVRKISDIKPDLVLADVFMPVRNGYEVCKYVKDDSALSHIPVILLVGAFDPLDEQEAQRVGADGVLKKPFVPPDPLISMVKSALSRAGVVVGAPAEPPPPPPAPAEFKPLALHPPPPPPPPTFEEPVEDIPVRPTPINIDRSAQPVAFGSLLETPGTEEGDDTSELVSPARVERDWRSTEEEQMDVEEDQEEPASSWRPGATDMDVDDIPAGKKDWREAAFAGIKDSTAKSSHSAVEEEPELVGAEEVNSSAPSAYAAEDTWSQAVAKGVEAETQQVTEAAKWIPAPTSIEMADAIAIQEAALITTPSAVHEVAPAPAAVAPPVPEPAPVVAKENSSWMSVAPNPWEAEAAKASKLAATWDTASVAVAPEPPPQMVVQEPEPEAVSAAIPAVTEQAIREEAAQVVEEVAHEIEEPVTQTSQLQAAEAAPAAAPNVDDVVAKILAKMDPSALQAMTRELLKPMIESIVREELSKK